MVRSILGPGGHHPRAAVRKPRIQAEQQQPPPARASHEDQVGAAHERGGRGKGVLLPCGRKARGRARAARESERGGGERAGRQEARREPPGKGGTPRPARCPLSARTSKGRRHATPLPTPRPGSEEEERGLRGRESPTLDAFPGGATKLAPGRERGSTAGWGWGSPSRPPGAGARGKVRGRRSRLICRGLLCFLLDIARRRRRLPAAAAEAGRRRRRAADARLSCPPGAPEAGQGRSSPGAFLPPSGSSERSPPRRPPRLLLFLRPLLPPLGGASLSPPVPSPPPLPGFVARFTVQFFPPFLCVFFFSMEPEMYQNR